MEVIAFIILATIIVCVLIVIIAKLSGSKAPVNREEKQFEIDVNTPDGKIVQKVKTLFDNNVALPYKELINELGLSFSDHNFENADYKDAFNSYSLAISNRYNLINDPILPIDSDQFNLNLQDGELLYYRISGTELFEEKVVRRNVTYSGTRWSSGPLRAGALSYSSHAIKDFLIQDIGRLFLTNKRLIFVGKNKNVTKAIKLSNIITYYLYQDGVLVLQGNSKSVLFKFMQFSDPVFLQDSVNEFTSVISRLLDNTQDQNKIQSNNEIEKSDDNDSVSTPFIPNELLPDPLLLETAYFALDLKVISAKQIQLKFKIGLYRSNKILNELADLKIVTTPNMEGQSTVLVSDKNEIDNLIIR